MVGERRMAVQPTYPGVYVQEVPSGVRTIVGVATSIGCYVTRIANGAAGSTITLQNEAKQAVLQLTALSAGALGDTIRAGVDYNTPTPEKTFNLRLFQSSTDSRGQAVQANGESWTNLSMDPASPSYAPTVLT